MAAPQITIMSDAPVPYSPTFSADAFRWTQEMVKNSDEMNSLVKWLNDNISSRPVVQRPEQTFGISTEYSGAYIRATYAGEKTIILSPESVVAQADGAVYFIVNQGSGGLTISAGAGVTISGNAILAQGASAFLQRVSANTYDFLPIGGDFLGDLTELNNRITEALDKQVSGNLIPTDTEFEAPGTSGWALGYTDGDGAATLIRNYTGIAQLGNANTLAISAPLKTTGAQTAGITVAVQPYARYCFSVSLSAFRAKGSIFVQWFNQDGVWFASSNSTGIINNEAQFNVYNFHRESLFEIAPQGAAKAAFNVVLTADSALYGTVPCVFFAKPSVNQVTANETSVPFYAPSGGNLTTEAVRVLAAAARQVADNAMQSATVAGQTAASASASASTASGLSSTASSAAATANTRVDQIVTELTGGISNVYSSGDITTALEMTSGGASANITVPAAPPGRTYGMQFFVQGTAIKATAGAGEIVADFFEANPNQSLIGTIARPETGYTFNGRILSWAVNHPVGAFPGYPAGWDSVAVGEVLTLYSDSYNYVEGVVQRRDIINEPAGSNRYSGMSFVLADIARVGTLSQSYTISRRPSGGGILRKLGSSLAASIYTGVASTQIRYSLSGVYAGARSSAAKSVLCTVQHVGAGSCTNISVNFSIVTGR